MAVVEYERKYHGAGSNIEDLPGRMVAASLNPVLGSRKGLQVEICHRNQQSPARILGQVPYQKDNPEPSSQATNTKSVVERIHCRKAGNQEGQVMTG